MTTLEDLTHARSKFTVYYLASRFTGDTEANKARAAKIALAIMRAYPRRYVVPAVTSTIGIESAFEPPDWYAPLLALQATLQGSIFVAEDIGTSYGVSLEFLHAVFVLHKPVLLVMYDDAKDEATLRHYIPKMGCEKICAAKAKVGMLADKGDA